MIDQFSNVQRPNSVKQSHLPLSGVLTPSPPSQLRLNSCKTVQSSCTAAAPTSPPRLLLWSRSRVCRRGIWSTLALLKNPTVRRRPLGRREGGHVLLCICRYLILLLFHGYVLLCIVHTSFYYKFTLIFFTQIFLPLGHVLLCIPRFTSSVLLIHTWAVWPDRQFSLFLFSFFSLVCCSLSLKYLVLLVIRTVLVSLF